MKALFIGGTGTISSDITKLCVKKGFDITLLNRGNSNNKLPEGITKWIFDINDEAAVKERLKNEYFDVVVNFISFNTEQTERDIRLFSGKTNQYIFISSASAYQKPRSHYLITESTPLANPYWQYSRDKIACEDRLMAEYRSNGFPITIVRPSHTYDENKIPLCIHGSKGSWATLKRIMDGKPVIIIGDGTSFWPLTHSIDFAKAFTGIMGSVQAIGESFHITSDEVLNWNQIYKAIGNALGAEPKLFHVSSDFLAQIDDYTGPLIGDKGSNPIFDNSKIKRFVPGFTADIRFDQGARMAADYYLNNKEAQIPDPDFDRFTDKVIEAMDVALKYFRENL